MRFILHRELNDVTSADSYNLGKEMLYFLGERLHLSGISQFYYLRDESHKKPGDYNYKLKCLLNWTEGEEKEHLEKTHQALKDYNKLKNKESRLIVIMNQMKRTVDEMFVEYIEAHIKRLDLLFGTHNFRGIVEEEDRVKFYHIRQEDSFSEKEPLTKLTDILSLQLSEEDGEHPILFMCNDLMNTDPIIDLELESFEDKGAKLLDKGYLVDVLYFNAVSKTPTPILKAIANEFSTKAAPIIQKLKVWAKECYENPNTTKGLDYFTKEIAPIIEQYKKLSLELENNKIITNATQTDKISCLQFGELPITKIWELFYKAENCSEEEYQQLLKIKEEQAPKFDGRWPVVFYKSHSKIKQHIEQVQQEYPQQRKTLDID